jgi:hypothetical protein
MSPSKTSAATNARPAADVASLNETSEALAEHILSLVSSGRAAEPSTASMQQLMNALVLLYGARFKAELRDSPIPAGRNIEATPVLVTASALLKAANLELFELGMWQSWSGTR